MFYLDFIGNAEDNNVKQLLDELGKQVRFIRVLGCYASKDVDRIKVDIPIQTEEKIYRDEAAQPSEEKKN